MSSAAVRNHPRARVLWALGLTGLLSLASCAGSSFDGRVYRNDEHAFRVGPLPRNWRPIESDTALLAFRDDTHGATIALSGRCGKDGDDVPLQALTHHLFLHFTDRQVLSQDIVPLDGRDALRTEIIAELDGVPKHFDVYVLKKDGCVYDFLNISASSSPPSERAEFERFVRGFATLSGS
jgi:hypothetical protein